MTIASRFFERAMKLPPAPNRAVQVERDLRVPMPDGVQLLADRYVPGGAGRPPLVLVRSPYGRRGFWGLVFGRLLAERGFQVLIQSCRGTFGSGGTLDPFGPDEHDDGLATRRLRPVMNQLPLRDLDRLATGQHAAYYQEWLAHNEPGDDYWKGRRFTDTLDRVTAPVSMVGGWHDIFLPLQLRDYAALRRAGHEPY